METWRLLDLGMAGPLMAQTFYEAVAHHVDSGFSPNTIILVQPSRPYVCLGFHQELEKEIDVEYCRAHNLPIIRRSQGGGATYLDANQVFYQIVTRKESEVIPSAVGKLFETLLGVTVYVYQKLGLPVEFKALNDVIIDGRKISGNGAGEFGENTVILVGNIILDLDYASMARVLRVPSEKFRDKMAKSMQEWVTSLRKELGYIPPVEKIKRFLTEGYERILGLRLISADTSDEEKNVWEQQVKPRHLSHEWLYMLELRHKELSKERAVKIAGGVKIVEANHKAKKLIRVRAELLDEKILDLLLSGDFFMMPENALPKLESRLKGATLSSEELSKRIRDFYEKNRIQTPGILPEDFAEAIMKLKDLL